MVNSRTMALVGVLGLAWATACAPALAPAPVVSAPRFPDFVFPAVPASMARADGALRQQRGWQFLQAGDLRGARREFNAALKGSPAFYPAEAGLGYVSLADKEFGDAVAHFDRALRQAGSYVPALVGRGDAFAGAGKLDDATKAYREALAADGSLTDVRRRLDVLAFRGQQAAVTEAQRAADQGRFDEAIAAYERAIASSPDSGLLYRELAAVEQKRGRQDAAAAHLRKAVDLDPSDARAWMLLGASLEQRADFAGAADAYARADALEPGEEAKASLARARSRADLARLPEEYQAIGKATQVTRGELAALVGVRLAALLQASGKQDAVVVTDVRSHWAAPWIMATVRAGVMEPYPNHAFAPKGLVRRLDLAQVASRLLALIEVRRPTLGRQWRAAHPRIADLPASHLGYPAAALVVGADVMPLDGTNFRPTRLVPGAEAIDVIHRLEVLAR